MNSSLSSPSLNKISLVDDGCSSLLFPQHFLKHYNLYKLFGQKVQIILYNSSYYRQFSADIKVKNNKINQFFILQRPKAYANKTGINLMIFILKFEENCL